MFTQEDLSRVAEITSRLCALPALPTAGWCDQAAEALVPRDHRDVLVVALAERSDVGLTILVPDDQVRLARERELWTWMDQIRVSEARTINGCLCTSSSNASLVCLMAPVSRSSRTEPGPWILIGVAIARSDAEALDHEAGILAVILPRLADRCRIAFGEAPRPEPLHLTPAEHRVLELLVLGRSVNQIADALVRSPHTIHDHVKSLHRKLGASSRGQLIARALGVSDPPTRSHRV